MSVEQYVPDPRDPDLRVYSELVAVRRFSEFSVPGYWHAELQVLRFRDVIYRKIFESDGYVTAKLDEELAKLYLRFPEKPHGLHFRFRFEIMNDLGQLLNIFVVFDGLITKSYVPSPKGKKGGTLNVRTKGKAEVVKRRITSVVVRTRNSQRKQTFGGSSSQRLPTQIKGLRPSPQNVDPTSFHYEGRSTVPNSDVDALQTYMRYQRTYSGQRTPNFKKVRKRDLKPLPYSMLLSKFYDDGGYTVRTDGVGPSNPGYAYLRQSIYFAGDFSDFTTKKTTHISGGANAALARLAARANSGSANIPEDLFTAAQTLRLFTNNVDRLRAFANAIRGGASFVVALKAGRLSSSAGGIARAQRLLDKLRQQGVSGSRLLAALWLEFRYGWIPLINDIKDSIAVFSDLITKSPSVTSLTATSTRNEEFLRDLFTDNIAGNTKPTGQSMTRKRTKTRYGLVYKVSDPYLHAAAQLGFTSPVALGWELIPFSFVVDWFLPIGQTLQLLHAFEGLNFYSGYLTQFTKTITTVSYNFDKTVDHGGGFIDKYTRIGRGTAEAYLHSRTVLTDFPRPDLPTPKSPFSVIHAANAAALLTIALTK